MSMYSFLLTLTKTNANLQLLRDGEIVAEKQWLESRDMGRQLFEAIATLLEEHELKPTDIADFQLNTDVSDNFTPLDSQATKDFWSTRHVAPGLDNPTSEPLLSDLTGLTSVKIAETVMKVYNWGVSVQAKTIQKS